MAEKEVGALANPCFSYDRCPRYERLNEVAAAREQVRLALELGPAAVPGVKVEGGKPPPLTAASWRKRAQKEMARWEVERKENDDPRNTMWALIVFSDGVRRLSAEECDRDGYVQAFVVTKDNKTVTVGQSKPKTDEVQPHHTTFLTEYDTSAQAQSTGDMVEGVKTVRTVNDTCGIILFELTKVLIKFHATMKIMDEKVYSHLSLYTEASNHMDEARDALDAVERYTDCYKVIMEMVQDRIAHVLRLALQAQRADAVCTAPLSCLAALSLIHI